MAKEQSSNDKQLSRIERLPAELQFLILDNLNQVHSTCLGLTCKQLYEVHRYRHCSVHLYLVDPFTGKKLKDFLTQWMGDTLVDGMMYFYGKFVTKELLKRARQDLLEKGIGSDYKRLKRVGK